MFDAFVSYSHAADGKLAPALQSGLQRLAKPLFKLRALSIFRDKTGLPLTPALWPKIEEALSQSRYFVLLASPEAARSQWVCEEIECWLRTKDVEHFLIAWTGGDLVWDAVAGDFDWQATDALPAAQLRSVFPAEPLFADLRAFKSVDALTLKHPEFAQEVALIASPLRAMTPGDLLSEEVRQHRRLRTLTVASLAALATLAGLAIWQALVADRERERAEEQARIADERRLVAVAQRMGTDAELMRVREPARLHESVLLAMESIRRLGAQGHPFAGPQETLRRGASLLPAASVAQVGESRAGQGATFSPDGRWLASHGEASVRLWETGTWTRRIRAKTGDKVKGIIFAPGGQWFAAWGESEVMVWDLVSMQRIERLRSDQVIVAVAFACEPRRALIVSSDGRLREWIPEGESAPRRITALVESWPAPVFDACATQLAYAQRGKGVMVYDLLRARTVFRAVPANRPHVLVLSAAGDRLAAMSAEQTMVGARDPVVQIWDVRSGGELARIGQENWVTTAEFSPDGIRLATAVGGVVRILDTQDGREISRMVHERDVRSLDFSADGGWLASDDGGLARVWAASSGREVSRLVVGKKVSSVAFHPTSERLAVSDGNQVSIVDVSSGAMAAQRMHQDRVLSDLDFGGGGSWVGAGSLDGAMTLWDALTGRAILDIAAGAEGRIVAASRDGRRLATMSGVTLGHARTLRLWDASTGEQVGAVSGAGSITAAAFAADSRRLLVGDDAGSVGEWDAATAERTGSHELGSTVIDIVCASQAAICAIGTWDGKVMIQSQARAPVSHAYTEESAKLAISPAGDRIAVAAGNVLTLVASADGAVVMRVEHAAPVLAARFNGDGAVLASASSDGWVHISDITSRGEIARLPNTRPVAHLAFGPRGRWLAAAAGGFDRGTRETRYDVNIWRLSDRLLVSSIQGATDVAFSLDGVQVATGTREGGIQVWKWPPDELALAACRRLPRNLDVDQWQRHAPDEPQRDTCAKDVLATPDPWAARAGAALGLVRDYYAALDMHDLPGALAMWDAPTARLTALIENVEAMAVDDARLLALGAASATIAVDVVGRQRGGASEKWKGAVYLKEGQSGWKIERMNMVRRE